MELAPVVGGDQEQVADAEPVAPDVVPEQAEDAALVALGVGPAAGLGAVPAAELDEAPAGEAARAAERERSEPGLGGNPPAPVGRRPPR